MSIEKLKKDLILIKDNIQKIKIQNIDFNIQKKDSLIFSKRKDAYSISNLKNNISKLKQQMWYLLPSHNDKNKVLCLLNLINEFDNQIKLNKIDKTKEIINELILNLSDINMPHDNFYIKKDIKMPIAIKEEILADLEELENCFKNKLYRSSIILCGRILEIALHRKYYEITNKDILETQPGIGLGKLVAKLSEKKAFNFPGISEQIHLINKVRIQSVHKKQELFIASREQTYATILYTLDIVEKLFR